MKKIMRLLILIVLLGAVTFVVSHFLLLDNDAHEIVVADTASSTNITEPLSREENPSAVSQEQKDPSQSGTETLNTPLLQQSLNEDTMLSIVIPYDFYGGYAVQRWSNSTWTMRTQDRRLSISLRPDPYDCECDLNLDEMGVRWGPDYWSDGFTSFLVKETVNGFRYLFSDGDLLQPRSPEELAEGYWWEDYTQYAAYVDLKMPGYSRLGIAYTMQQNEDRKVAKEHFLQVIESIVLTNIPIAFDLYMSADTPLYYILPNHGNNLEYIENNPETSFVEALFAISVEEENFGEFIFAKERETDTQSFQEYFQEYLVTSADYAGFNVIQPMDGEILGIDTSQTDDVIKINYRVNGAFGMHMSIQRRNALLQRMYSHLETDKPICSYIDGMYIDRHDDQRDPENIEDPTYGRPECF